MQAAMQAFVDNSLSKTINFPEDATEEDVAMSYQLAWKLGCKGITVYITCSRQKVVLETKAIAKQKLPTLPIETGITTKAEQLRMWQETKKPRPRRLPGYTYNIGTPVGKAFVPINENGDKQPFQQKTFTLHDEQFNIVDDAITKARTNPIIDTGLNDKRNPGRDRSALVAHRPGRHLL